MDETISTDALQTQDPVSLTQPVQEAESDTPKTETDGICPPAEDASQPEEPAHGEVPEQEIPAESRAPGQQATDRLEAVLMELCDLTRGELAARETQARQNGLDRIRALDPEISSVSDLFAMEGSETFYNLVVKSGLDWDTAYRAVCFDKLISRAQSRGAQEERNRIQSRSHLERTRSRGTPSDSVPPEIMAIYRAMNPTASEAEIVRHYNHTK